MPNFISKDGEWHPAKEKVALRDANGEPFVYEAADREAVRMMWEQAGKPEVGSEKDLLEKVKPLGKHFLHNTELRQRAKELGYKNVKEYAEVFGYDQKASEANFEKNASKITLHSLPERNKQVKPMGGGHITVGSGEDMYGDFGNPPALK